MHRVFAFFILVTLLWAFCGCKNQAPAPELQQGIAPEPVGARQPDAIEPTLPGSDQVALLHAAQAVLDRLYKAGGDFRCRPPGLSLSNTTAFMAAFRPRSNTIVLERKALEIARSFGQDSLEVLAFVLGHELTHFYQNEGSPVGQASNFLAFGKNEGADVRWEKQADLEGVFLAFVAGFKKISTLMPAIVDQIYEAYDLKSKKLSSYPSILERKQTAGEVRQQADSLFHVYEAAAYFTGLGQYQAAMAACQYLESVFSGYELYNNLGVLWAAQALQIGGKRIDTLLYPFETDLSPRFEKARAALLSPSEKQHRASNLQQAEICFQKALSLFPQYSTARVNLCCVTILQDRPDEALEMLRQMDDGGAVNLLLEGLARNSQGQRETVKSLFRRAAASGSGATRYIAALDADILEGLPLEPDRCSWRLGATYPYNLKPRDLRMQDGLSLGEHASLYWLQTSHTTVYVCRWPGRSCAVQIIRSAAVEGAPEGVSIGRPLRNKKSGWLPLSIQGNRTFWKVGDCPVLLLANEQNKLEKWAVLLPL